MFAFVAVVTAFVVGVAFGPSIKSWLKIEQDTFVAWVKAKIFGS